MKLDNMVDFPYDIEDAIGELLLVQEEAPGVYFVLTKKDDDGPSGGQFYIVKKSSPAISMSARKYGKPIEKYSDILLFDIDDTFAGQKIVEFEVARYKLKNGCPDTEREDVCDAACAGMETNPEFFGNFPVPAQTPYGRLIRYKVLSNGIYWIETDQLKTVLAICDVYEDQLYDGTRRSAISMDNEEDPSPWTFSYLFYPYKSSCVPLFELLPLHHEWVSSRMIEIAALMNAIWEYHPEYAAAYNANEVMGLHDGIGNLLQSLGEAIPLHTSLDHTLKICPEAGLDFCTLFE